MSYLDEVKEEFKRFQGGAPVIYSEPIRELTKILALIAIAEELQQLNKLLESVTNYSGSAININKLGE